MTARFPTTLQDHLVLSVTYGHADLKTYGPVLTVQTKRVDRREFLKVSAAGGASLLLPPVAGAKMDAQVGPFELDEISATELGRMLASGKETSLSLTRKYLEKIHAVDLPLVHSVIELNPDAEAIASALDEERRNGHVRGSLHGIPVLIKDNIDTADRMRTTAGSLALIDNVATSDSTVAARLRLAGAVILGKTNLSEWANFRASHSTSGWSGRGRQTNNPYALDRNPSGSSSGTAAAVASSFCAVGVGTETDGSIISPSNNNGVVGIKPTVGLIGRTGIIPISSSQDTAGPMARTVSDAAILLGALAYRDPQDPKAVKGGAYLSDYSAFLDKEGLRGARIGVARNFFGFSDQVDKVMAEALDLMKRLGAVLVDPANIDTDGKFGVSEQEVLLYEFKAGLNMYLDACPPSVKCRSLKELIEFNEAHRDQEMPYFGQELFLQAQEKGPLSDSKYLKAVGKNVRLSRREGIDKTMNEHRLDAIVAPSGGPAWTTDLVNGDHFSGGSSSPAAVAGYPNINVPAGFVHGLPVGISFFGRAWSEGTLIRLAYAFEQATQARKAPHFRPSMDFS